VVEFADNLLPDMTAVRLFGVDSIATADFSCASFRELPVDWSGEGSASCSAAVGTTTEELRDMFSIPFNSSFDGEKLKSARTPA
jgi:hypothetical protein